MDTGQGVQTFEIVATKAGRRVEISTARGVVEVAEVTRNGQSVRVGRFMASRIIALVEHPATEPMAQATDRSARRGRRAQEAAALGVGLWEPPDDEP